MAIVIGLDFGDYNSYTSCIPDLDTDRRQRGEPLDLLPPSASDGVPSVFFFDGRGGFLVGRTAVTGAARQERSRVLRLRRSLGKPLEIGGKPVVIDGKAWRYDDAVREVVQSVLREANTVLQETTRQTTELVSLAYPAAYSPAQRERLVRIVNSATLKNSDRHFQVIGTIAEPAAAALDCLARKNCGKDTTVLVFDLGGGALDLSLVTCYPDGKKPDGAYYEVHLTDRLPGVGGREFDEAVFGLLRDKLEERLRQAGYPTTSHLEEQLRENSERWKKELSGEPYRTVCVLYVPALDEEVELELTREELESAPRVREMLRKMTDKTSRFLRTPGAPQPERLALAGGACRMPMIREALSGALPEYAQIIDETPDRPEMAVSRGAARYGIPENPDPGPIPFEGKSGERRTAREIGVRFHRSARDDPGYIVPFIPGGAGLPFDSPWASVAALEEENEVCLELYEAAAAEPDRNELVRDYRRIKTVTIRTGAPVRSGDRFEVRLRLKADGRATLEARTDQASPLLPVLEDGPGAILLQTMDQQRKEGNTLG